MTLAVHYLNPPSSQFIEDLRKLLKPKVRLTHGPERQVPADTHILIAGRPSPSQLSISPKLHALIIPWAGFPTETRKVMGDFPHISIHNLHHNAIAVAEMAITLLLAASKFIIPMDRSLRAHDWTPRYRPSPTLLLRGKTVLILGFGAIGKYAGGLCKQFGMKVLATVRHQPELTVSEFADHIVSGKDLHSLLPHADALIICLPHTPETEGLIGRKELALMPRGAVLVNIGRGPIVDQESLYKALQSDQLHAAGLDVWYNYPVDETDRSNTPPSDFPFHELDNIVMSPHRAGSTKQSNVLRMDSLANLINAAALGQPIPNRVDIEAGY